MKRLIILLWICLASIPAFAQDLPAGDQKPPLSAARITGELIAGTAGGVLVGGGIGYAVAIASCEGATDPLCGLGGVLVGLGVLPIGTAVGVYGIGSLGDQTGSWERTMTFSYLGMVPGLAIAAGIDSPQGLWAIPIGAVIGGVIGFNLYREYESTENSFGALINFKSGQARLGLPVIYPNQNPEDDSLSLMIHFVHIQFQ